MRSNLPEQLTSFIGRQKEITEVKNLLHKTRLLTLTGAGGSGKTRLALEVARSLTSEDFLDDIHFMALEALSDPSLVPQAVASAAGVREEPGRSITATLLDTWQASRVLLVLDNCEHLVNACFQLANELLRHCPGVRILATSREALGVEGETAWRVPSLTLPDPREPAPLEVLGHYEAVRLFVERAAFSRPNFAMTEQNAQYIVQLCHRLDGLPLAIELAAARIKVLSVEQIVDRLDERFRLLTSGSPLALPRQQTLRALLDWSYDLLSTTEQALLRALSVFSGSLSLEAAKAICMSKSGEIDEYALIDLLDQLVSKSLLVVEEHSGEARYRLLETIRQYAYEKLCDAGEVNAERTCHRDYYVVYAEQVQPKLASGEEQRPALRKLDIEHDNIRVALDWSIHGQPDARCALRLAGAVWRFWDMRGYLSEGRKWLENALAMTGDVSLPVRAKALSAAGNLALDQGDYEQAEEFHEQALALRREIGDRMSIASSLSNLGVVARMRGNYPRALQLYEQALALFNEIGAPASKASVLDNMGFVMYCMGDYDGAEKLYYEALALFRKADDVDGAALAFNNLGEVAQSRGDWSAARKYYLQAMDLVQQVDDRLTMVGVLNNLGMVANHEEEYERAEDLFKESLEMCQADEYRQGIAECLEGLAAARVRKGGTGQPERGTRLFGAVEALREKTSAHVSPSKREYYKRYIDWAQAALGDTTFAVAWAIGRTMTQDEAIKYALEAVQEVAVGRLPGTLPGPPYPAGLTKREMEILVLVAGTGLTDAQIAEQLSLSPRTVHAHLHSIYNKLGVTTRSAATRWAIENGLI